MINIEVYTRNISPVVIYYIYEDVTYLLTSIGTPHISSWRVEEVRSNPQEFRRITPLELTTTYRRIFKKLKEKHGLK